MPTLVLDEPLAKLKKPRLILDEPDKLGKPRLVLDTVGSELTSPREWGVSIGDLTGKGTELYKMVTEPFYMPPEPSKVQSKDWVKEPTVWGKTKAFTGLMAEYPLSGLAGISELALTGDINKASKVVKSRDLSSIGKLAKFSSVGWGGIGEFVRATELTGNIEDPLNVREAYTKASEWIKTGKTIGKFYREKFPIQDPQFRNVMDNMLVNLVRESPYISPGEIADIHSNLLTPLFSVAVNLGTKDAISAAIKMSVSKNPTASKIGKFLIQEPMPQQLILSDKELSEQYVRSGGKEIFRKPIEAVKKGVYKVEQVIEKTHLDSVLKNIEKAPTEIAKKDIAFKEVARILESGSPEPLTTPQNQVLRMLGQGGTSAETVINTSEYMNFKTTMPQEIQSIVNTVIAKAGISPITQVAGAGLTKIQEAEKHGKVVGIDAETKLPIIDTKQKAEITPTTPIQEAEAPVLTTEPAKEGITTAEVPKVVRNLTKEEAMKISEEDTIGGAVIRDEKNPGKWKFQQFTETVEPAKAPAPSVIPKEAVIPKAPEIKIKPEEAEESVEKLMTELTEGKHLFAPEQSIDKSPAELQNRWETSSEIALTQIPEILNPQIKLLKAKLQGYKGEREKKVVEQRKEIERQIKRYTNKMNEAIDKAQEENIDWQLNIMDKAIDTAMKQGLDLGEYNFEEDIISDKWQEFRDDVGMRIFGTDIPDKEYNRPIKNIIQDVINERKKEYPEDIKKGFEKKIVIPEIKRPVVVKKAPIEEEVPEKEIKPEGELPTPAEKKVEEAKKPLTKLEEPVILRGEEKYEKEIEEVKPGAGVPGIEKVTHPARERQQLREREDIEEDERRDIRERAATTQSGIYRQRDILGGKKGSRRGLESETERDTELLNYRIQETDQIGIGTPKGKFRNNVDAIQLLKQLETENRLATSVEQSVLVKYVGWGGLSQTFDSYNEKWEKEYQELKELLTEEEFEAARKSTINAFYTSPEVITAMWNALEKMGFKGGKALEPGMGVGHFIGLRPNGIKIAFTGIELDKLTGRIAKQLYQNSDIHIKGFEETLLPRSSYDIAISNVPFADYKPFDPRSRELGIPTNFLLHDFFFAKSLALVKPGGLIAFITSKGTMDKQNTQVREFINKQADFIGAIRLPSTAFEKVAGTKVVTDIVFLRKKLSGEIFNGEQWLNTVETKVSGRNVFINEYFVKYPDMVLGKMKLGHGLYTAEELVVDSFDEPLKTSLEKVLEKLPANIMKELSDIYEIQQRVSMPDTSNLLEGAFIIKNNKIYQKIRHKKPSATIAARVEQQGMLVEELELEEQVYSKDDFNRMSGMIKLRDISVDLLNKQMKEITDEELDKSLRQLNTEYDKFVNKYGFLNDKKNMRLFSADPYAPRLSSLEKEDDINLTFTKADIFKKRVIPIHIRPTQADNSKDAMFIALSEFGKLNFDYMAGIAGMEKEELIKELSNTNEIFKDPAGDRWVIKDEYLSGNVKLKLAEAEVASKENPFFAKNVEALRKVIPIDIPFEKIDVKPGCVWIQPDTYKQFIGELLNVSENMWDDIKVELTMKGWLISLHRYSWIGKSAENTKKWGIEKYTAVELIEAIANNKTIEVRKQIIDEKGGKTTILDMEATNEAKEKAEILSKKFSSWLWEKPERAEEYTRIYNDLNNNTVQRKYDGSHLRFPGLAEDIKFRKSQLNAVWRGIVSKRLLLAHEVGAGKTWIGIAILHEKKRLGLINKPFVIVPSNTLPQWRRMWNQLYPQDNILCADPEHFEKKKRQQFLSIAAHSNWDAIIIGNSSNELISVFPETEAEFIRAEINELISYKEQLREAGIKISVKNIEKSILKAETKLKTILDPANKDLTIKFEELGLDSMYIDESDYYKNLRYTTMMKNIKGLGSPEGSAKCMDILMKIRTIQRKNGDIIFATGTPISNTMAETHSIMRYLQPELLKEKGLEHFDMWANQFGRIVTGLEIDVAGKYKISNRFSKFVNIPELMQMLNEVWDIQTGEMLEAQGILVKGRDLPLIKGNKPEMVILPKSNELRKYMKELGKRVDTLKGKRVVKGGDNMLVVLHDGIKASFDMRLVDPAFPADPNGKCETAIRDIIDTWHTTKPKKLTQLIFIDLTKPDPKAPFNPQWYIKRRLIDAGIPEKEIAFIHDYETMDEKEILYDAMNKGEIRILFGSTAKLGAGTNVQNKLLVLYHLDTQMRPRDMTQREGRILRPGNSNKEIVIKRYSVKGSLDPFLWQMLEAKAKTINMIMSGDSSIRDFEDEINEYSIIKAASSDNPLVQEKVNIDSAVIHLQSLKNAFIRSKMEAQKEVETLPAKINKYKEIIEKVRQYITKRPPKPTKETFGIEIQGKIYKTKDEGWAILKQISNKAVSEANYIPMPVGKYLGYNLTFILQQDGRKVIEIDGLFYGVLSDSAIGSFASIDHAIYGQPEPYAESLENTIIADERNFAVNKEIVAKEKFDKETELEAKLKRQVEINRLLQAQAEGQEADEREETEKYVSEDKAPPAPEIDKMAKMEVRTDQPSAKKHPLEMPELVRLAKELLGSTPIVKRLARNYGYFKHYEGSPEGRRMALDFSIFKNPDFAASVLSHEIGHLIDWLPDYTLRRGNLLGRLHTLQNFLKGTFGSEAVKNSEIRVELKNLTQYWNPFDEETNPNFTKKRYSSRELYAEALSVLLCEPETMEEKAPNFYRIFWEQIDKKPVVKDALMDLMNTLTMPEEEKLIRRQQDVQQMFKKGKELFYEKLQERRERKRSILFELRDGLIDKNMYAIQLYNKAVKDGLKISPDDNPLLFLEEDNYIGGKQTNMLENINVDVREALLKEGIGDETIGEYMFHKNIVEGKIIEKEAEQYFEKTKMIARPLGFSPETSKKQLEFLEKQLGDKKWELLENRMAIFYKMGQDLMEEAYQSGLLTDDQIRIAKANPYYATSQVLDYMNTYISASFIHQLGTLKPVANPLYATILKRLSLRIAIEKNNTKKQLYTELLSKAEGETEKAKQRYTGTPLIEFEKKEGKGILKFKRNGKWEGYYVDEYIANEQEFQPNQVINAMIRIFRVSNTKWFRPIFTTWNIPFQSFNLVRDATRAVKANPHKSLLLSILDKMESDFKAIPHALNRVRGIRDELITEMRENKMLGITYQQTIDMGDLNDFNEMIYLTEKFGVGITKKAGLNLVKKILDWIGDLGNFIESIPKISGYITLKESDKPIPMREIGHAIRNYYGSPDFRTFGRWGSVYNNIFLFSNAIKQGIRSDITMGFIDPRTRTGFWWKTFQLNIIPKILLALALAGAFGEYIRRILKKATDYDKANYIIIPLFLDKDGNAVYLRIPQDETGRQIGATVWNLINSKDTTIGKEISDLMSFYGGQLPSFSPLVEILMTTGQYVSGHNPYDAFRGREILTDQEEKLLRSESIFSYYPAKRMAIWNIKQLGIPIPAEILRTQKPRKPMNDLQKIVAYTPILSRYLRVTKYGEEETMRKKRAKLEASRTKRRLELKSKVK